MNSINKAFRPFLAPQFCQLSTEFADKNMPKKKGTPAQIDSTSSSTTEKGPVTQTKEGNFTIAIQVKPGAKVNAITGGVAFTGVSDEAVSLQISAPPVDGEANAAILKFFSEILHVKKTEVSLKGGKSRQKVVTVANSSLSVDKIMEILRSQM